MARELLGLGGHAELPVVAGLGKPLSDERRGVMLGHEGEGLLEKASPVLRTESDPDREAVVEALAAAIEAAAPDGPGVSARASSSREN